MKKTYFVTVLGIAAVVTAAAVHAQTTMPVTTPASMPSTAPAVAVTPSTAAPATTPAVATPATPAPVADVAPFGVRKQKQLDSISEHIANMQKRQTCIQAAQDEKALGACSHVVNEVLHPADKPKATSTTPPAATPAITPAPALTTTPATPVKP